MEKSITLWTFGHALIMLVATAFAIIFDWLFLLIWTVSLSLIVLIAATYKIWIRLHPVGGFANQVTFGRFVLLIFTLGMHHVMNPIVFVTLILLVIIADGVDGFLARKFNQASQLGEIFDTEVDAFLALTLTFLLWMIHKDAGWILAAGLLRYGFVILYRLLGWHRKQRPSMPETKVIAVIFFISLLIPMIIEWDIAVWIVGFGCALVAISFVREFYLMAKA